MSEAKRVPSLGAKDDRNFRSHYYEKVGFRGVEERKTLEVLWSDDPLNIDKFSSFALKHSLPSCDRLQVWKVCLGTVFENPQKCRISTFLLRLHFEFIKNAKKSQFCRVFENLKFTVKQCYQTGQFCLDKNC